MQKKSITACIENHTYRYLHKKSGDFIGLRKQKSQNSEVAIFFLLKRNYHIGA